jgi:hypothetical protein
LVRQLTHSLALPDLIESALSGCRATTADAGCTVDHVLTGGNELETMAATPNPRDAIREQILRYFYDRNANATSRFGKKGSAIKISDVKAELKARHGLTQQQVMANLTYLIDRGWVKTVEETKTVSTARGTTVPSVVTYYEVSAKGIDRIEGGSEFQPRDRYPGINIQATGSNVITLGDGNVVRAEYRQLFNELTQLKEAVSNSDELTDADKLSLSVDIESLRDQLAKAEPNRGVIRQLWSGIDKAAALAGLAQFVAAVEPHIAHLLR